MNKKLAILLGAAILLTTVAVPVSAHRFRRGIDDNPLRLLGYAFTPVGIVLEYGVMRPAHWLASQPHLDILMGHEASSHDRGTYFEWIHGNYEPSIAHERSKQRKMQAPKAAHDSSAPMAVEKQDTQGAK